MSRLICAGARVASSAKPLLCPRLLRQTMVTRSSPNHEVLHPDLSAPRHRPAARRRSQRLTELAPTLAQAGTGLRTDTITLPTAEFAAYATANSNR